jgi:hypothetical protein
MLSVEHTMVIHAEHRQHELLKAAQDHRRAEAARTEQSVATPTTVPRQRAGWTWPSLRARRAATA